ncbi:MAG TPA: hypothetical protein VFQ35_04890 [Polyangiaceae bacterium]|nr:hypothetical protein [Polyangiaceae bacterium]
MASPLAFWLMIMLIHAMSGLAPEGDVRARRAVRVVVVKAIFVTSGSLVQARAGWGSPGFVLGLIIYLFPGFFLERVILPLRWPRVAYWFSRATWPLSFSDSDQVGSCYYAARALGSGENPRLVEKFEKALAKGERLHGAGVVALGFLAVARREPEQALQFFTVAQHLHERFISRSVRAVARDYLVKEAMRTADYRTALELGIDQQLRWSYFVARACQRLLDDPAAPSNLALWFWWLLAPRRLRSYSLLQKAIQGGARENPPAPRTAREGLPGALGALASLLRRPKYVDTDGLKSVVAEVDRELGSTRTLASLEQRILDLGATAGADAVLRRLRDELVDCLVPLIEQSTRLRGTDDLEGTLAEAFLRAKGAALRELSTLRADYGRRADSEDTFDPATEWALWAKFRALGERVLRVDPSAEAALFAEAFNPVLNFAVFQHNSRKQRALAHSMYDWLHQLADSKAPDSDLLSKNMRAALSRP